MTHPFTSPLASIGNLAPFLAAKVQISALLPGSCAPNWLQAAGQGGSLWYQQAPARWMEEEQRGKHLRCARTVKPELLYLSWR